MRFGSLRGLALALPVVTVVVGTGCPEEPGGGRNASLTIAAADASLLVGETSEITVTSRGADGKGNTDTVTVVVTKADEDANLAGGVGPSADALGEGPLSLTPDDDGKAVFVVGCTGEGTMTLTFATEAVKAEKTQVVRCRLPDIDVTVQVLPFRNCSTLQADGNSSCEVIVNVRDGTNAAVQDFPIAVSIDSVDNITTPEANLAVNGIDEVLVAALGDQPRSTLVGLRTGSEGVEGETAGQTSFFVVSPRVNLEETVNFSVRAASDSQAGSATIGPFQDNSNLEMKADPAQITSGDTVVVTVTATDVDTTAASGGVVTVTAPDDFVLVPSANVTAGADGTFAILLADDGTGDITFTAPTVATLTNFEFSGTFQSIGESQIRSATAAVSVDIAGAVTRNAAVDRTLIKASGEPSKSILTLTAKQNGQPFNGVTATLTIGLASQSVITLDVGGDGRDRVPSAADPNPPQNDANDLAFATFVNGEATVAIVADSANSRGTGVVHVEIDAPGQGLFQTDITVTVDRDPVLQSIVYVGSDPDNAVIGVQGSQIATTAVLSFQLLDDNATPIAGLPVQFVENASDPLVTVDGGLVTDAGGIIKAILNAGRIASPVTVTGTATFGNRTLQADSEPIAIVAGLPNSEQSQLVCENTAQFDPFATTCTVNLGDRFSNFAVGGNVQFRAESGNITAFGADGSASFTFGNPGPGSADVLDWSFSPLRVLPAAQKAQFAGCFDDTITTDCDLLGICRSNNAVLQAFCPLQPNLTGTNNCTTDISALADAALDDQGVGEDAVLYEVEAFTGIDLVPTVDVQAQVAAYEAEHRACGFPLSCLQQQREGLFFDSADDCPVALGCLDYSTGTECPQASLLDILASFNGEEGFDDVNGNGVFDSGEEFVDFPEPFMDKNSNCTYDDLNDNDRLTPSQIVQNSDLFIDSDAGDGEFGFVVGNRRQESNGTYDLSTEVFLKTSIVLLEGAPVFQFGELVPDSSDCGPGFNTTVACVANAPQRSACTEIATGAVFTGSCQIGNAFRDGDVGNFVYRWRDFNGNCPSVDFADSSVVATDGPIELATANKVDLDNGVCGITPGAIDAANPARPWCEEHPFMAAPLLPVAFVVKCEGQEGPQPAKLIFTLGEQERQLGFVVNCPVCGDNRLEGLDEQCDDGNKNAGDGCDADCQVETP